LTTLASREAYPLARSRDGVLQAAWPGVPGGRASAGTGRPRGDRHADEIGRDMEMAHRQGEGGEQLLARPSSSTTGRSTQMAVTVRGHKYGKARHWLRSGPHGRDPYPVSGAGGWIPAPLDHPRVFPIARVRPPSVNAFRIACHVEHDQPMAKDSGMANGDDERPRMLCKTRGG